MNAASSWYVTSFYRFLPIREDQLESYKGVTKAWMAGAGLNGLVLFASEGINGTVAGDEGDVEAFKAFICELVGESDIRFKDSVSPIRPFHRLSVDIREEIVGMKRPDLVPTSTEDHHLSAREWHEALSADGKKLVIDTRNRYETIVGKFKGAVDPDLKAFSAWGEYLESADIPRDVPVYIYCTGGIRCEKAILEMHVRGFESVFQLRDGILGYLNEYPDGLFDGDCFVFDDRVALDKDLKPSGRFGICPGCGLTSGTKMECQRCGDPYFVCDACLEKWPPVCSKTCRDRWLRKMAKPIS